VRDHCPAQMSGAPNTLLRPSFEAVMMREERNKGFFVSFDYTSDALTEIDRFFRRSGKVIVPFTVGEILDEQIAQKLA
jgi:hypothetical protein